MKAILLTSLRQVQLVDRPKPRVSAADDVLIRVTSAGICTADLEIIAGTHPFARTGNVIGHEFGGVVEDMGEGVSNLARGDKVCVDPVCACGACHACQIGRPNVCEQLETMGVHRDGGFCEYVCVPADHVHRYQNQDLDERLLGVAEPFSIGAQNNARASVTQRDVVLVVGAGAIGLCAIQDAKRRGAFVISVDPLPQRKDRAMAMGADIAVCSKLQDNPNLIRQLTNGSGADVIINTSGYPGSVRDCAAVAARAGRIVIVGMNPAPIGLSQADFVEKELTICGSRLSTRLFPYVVSGIDSGAYSPRKLVTHFFPLERFGEAVQLIHSHPEEVCRVVLTPGEERKENAS